MSKPPTSSITCNRLKSYNIDLLCMNIPSGMKLVTSKEFSGDYVMCTLSDEHGNIGEGIYDNSLGKFHVITFNTDPPIYYKHADNTDTFYRLKEPKIAYRHVLKDEQPLILEVELPIDTIVSQYDDCWKVSEVIPKKVYQGGQSIPFDYVTSVGPRKLKYYRDQHIYPDKYVLSHQFTSGIYVCPTLDSLRVWGCNTVEEAEFMALIQS